MEHDKKFMSQSSAVLSAGWQSIWIPSVFEVIRNKLIDMALALNINQKYKFPFFVNYEAH